MSSHRCWISNSVILTLVTVLYVQIQGVARANVPLNSNAVSLLPVCLEGCTCDNFYQLVQCVDMDLVDIPNSSVRNSVRILHLHGNAISSLRGKSLWRFRQLRLLDLADNRIASISDDAFQSQPKLLKLDLSWNNLLIVPVVALSQLRSLRELDLARNHISVLNPESFVNLTKLQNLSLSFNNLHVISGDTFVGMDSLRAIYLDNNFLDEIPVGSLRDCNRLEHIYVSNNSIGTFINNSEILGQFSVRDWFKPLIPSRVKTLALPHNRIDIFSTSCFRGMTSLTGLDLSFNFIRDISGDLFDDLIELETLKLGNNPLNAIPPSLFRNTNNLLSLRVPNCELGALPDDLFSNATRLEIIDLTMNAVSDTKFLLPDHQLSLRQLLLGGNSISAFPDEGLTRFLHLETLDLSANYLKEVPDVKGLKYLETLDVSYNYYVTSLGAHAFRGTSLRSLDFSYNAFQTIKQSTFEDVPNLIRVVVNDNPWSCDCHLYWSLVGRHYASLIGKHIYCVWPEQCKDTYFNLECMFDHRLRICTTFPDIQDICNLISAWLAVVAAVILLFWAIVFHRARRRFRTRRPRKRFLLFRNPSETNAGSTNLTGHSNVRFKALDSETESLEDDETTV